MRQIAMRPYFVLATFAAVSIGQTCCGIGSSAVRFMGQTNLIVWDDRQSVEHFVRDAQFSTKSKDLGFIAPTPTEPELAEVNKGVFRTIESIGGILLGGKGRGSGGGFGGGGGGVQVLQEKNVGGYKAAVLRSSDGKDLYEWLQANGYSVGDSMKPWLNYYIKKGWTFTAFKVEKTLNGDTVSTGPVRLSFRTDKPYNPYYVPKENLPKEYGKEDTLSLYFIARGRYQGRVAGELWAGEKVWKSKLTSDYAKAIAADLKLSPQAIPEGCTVTKYTDPTFPRPAKADIFFEFLGP